jgi:hypothetical protein
MKLLKMLGLTVTTVATIAAMGASSASAGPTVLCNAHMEVCPAANQLAGHIEALAADTSLLTQAGAILCAHSVLLGNALGLNNPLIIHLTNFDFLNCEIAGNACEITTLEVGLALLLRTALNRGTLQLHNTRFLVECPGANIHCVYGGLPIAQVLGHNNQLEELATIHSNEVAWEAGGFFCPEGARLDALYRVLLPHPVYIAG